ncbi:hypothetical protein RCL1_001502 [Eukaryota sp. TZLM3-RCL]
MPTIDDINKYVICGEHEVNYTTTYAASDAWGALSAQSFIDIERFKRNLHVEVLSETEESLSFDLIGVDVSFANALRRILLSEIATMAVEHVVVLNNTSVIPDEVLAHRLGLIPLLVDAKLFEEVDPSVPVEALNGKQTLKFVLNVACPGKDKSKDPDDVTDEADLYINGRVFSKDFKWVPIDDQIDWIHAAPRPVLDDILISKLRTGQTISVEMYATKGVGATHAKWSPVSTAFYSLMPAPRIKRRVSGVEAENLRQVCPLKVLDIEDGELVVSNPRACTTCRECIRQQPKVPSDSPVELRKIRDHFMFTVESSGVLPAREILIRALDVLIGKCDELSDCINQLASATFAS